MSMATFGIFLILFSASHDSVSRSQIAKTRLIDSRTARLFGSRLILRSNLSRQKLTLDPGVGAVLHAGYRGQKNH